MFYNEDSDLLMGFVTQDYSLFYSYLFTIGATVNKISV